MAATDAEPESPYAGVEREYLWRQYNLWIELYKFHMKLVMEALAFYFAITGAMLSFAFAQPAKEAVSQTMIRSALLLPALLGIGIAAICCYGAAMTRDHRRDLLELARELGFPVVPDANFLRVTLWSSAVICMLTAIGLMVFIRMG